ncbi:hypothetical protein ACFQQB_20475 [Nonomuraea rubra]|uniref:hypothetical protein n=1 Tax=Nonomuraea rubra TaxID=46180 RepID=UPI003622321A
MRACSGREAAPGPEPTSSSVPFSGSASDRRVMVGPSSGSASALSVRVPNLSGE